MRFAHSVFHGMCGKRSGRSAERYDNIQHFFSVDALNLQLALLLSCADESSSASRREHRQC